MTEWKKRVFKVKLQHGRMPTLPGRDSRVPDAGEVRWHDDGRAYLISEVTRTGRDEVILVIQRVAAA
jgi:hypothetical protein